MVKDAMASTSSAKPHGHHGGGEGIRSDPVGLSTVQGPHPHVLMGMATCGGQEKLLSPLLLPEQGGGCRWSMAHGPTATAESCSHVPPKGAHIAQPSGSRGLAPPNHRLKKASGRGEPSPAEFCAI